MACRSRIILKHALRAALPPVVSYIGPAAAALMTGSVVVESIFGIPGVGRYFIDGALNRDYTLVMGAVIVIAVLDRRAQSARRSRLCVDRSARPP